MELSNFSSGYLEKAGSILSGHGRSCKSKLDKFSKVPDSSEAELSAIVSGVMEYSKGRFSWI
jgi:hypothetical protein